MTGFEEVFRRRTEPELTKQPSDVNFASVLRRRGIDDQLRADLKGANVLLVPEESPHEAGVPVFPSGTEQLYQYLKDNAPDTAKVDIAIRDEDYVELERHEALIIVPTVLATSLVFPIVVNLLSEWFKRRLGRQRDKAELKIEIIVVDEKGKSIAVRYEGPAEAFKETVQKAIKPESEGGAIPGQSQERR